MAAYKKRTAYNFDCAHENWNVTEHTADYIHFEETRKNGQEDCHLGGEANLEGGKWVIEEWARKNIDDYVNAGTADKLEAYFNKHPLPELF